MECAIRVHLVPEWLSAVASCQESWGGTLCVSQRGQGRQSRAAAVVFMTLRGSLYTNALSFFFSRVFAQLAGDRVQDKPPNLALWHSEYLLTEGIWDTAGAGRTFWPSLGTGHKTLVSLLGGKEHPYLRRQRDTDRNLKNRLCEASPAYYS